MAAIGFKRERIGSMIQARYYQINPECQKLIADLALERYVQWPIARWEEIVLKR
jgi:hypothetical protein